MQSYFTPKTQKLKPQEFFLQEKMLVVICEMKMKLFRWQWSLLSQTTGITLDTVSYLPVPPSKLTLLFSEILKNPTANLPVTKKRKKKNKILISQSPSVPLLSNKFTCISYDIQMLVYKTIYTRCERIMSSYHRPFNDSCSWNIFQDEFVPSLHYFAASSVFYIFNIHESSIHCIKEIT